MQIAQACDIIISLVLTLRIVWMKEGDSQKQHAKLLKYQKKAQLCLTRKEAQKLIKKSDKTHNKLAA